MIVTFPGMIAQQESQSISENMRWSYKKRMESGDFNCCRPAYGFDMKENKLIVNNVEKQIVQQIFNMYLQGFGKQAIANSLNNNNICKRYGNKKWYSSTITYILNNERYIGNALLQKMYTTTTLPFRKIKNKGEMPQYYVENSNPSIITKPIYESVKQLQKFRMQDNKAGKRKQYPLSGIIRCVDCGHTYRRQIVRKIAYWLCSYKAAGRTDCKSKWIRENDIYHTFSKLVFKLAMHRKYILISLVHQMECIQYKTNENQKATHLIDQKIADLSSQNHVISKLYNKGILNTIEFTEQSSKINNQINQLRIERRKNISNNKDEKQLNELKELNELLEHYQLYHFDENLFSQIVDKIVVLNQNELKFTLIGGLTLTEKIDE